MACQNTAWTLDYWQYRLVDHQSDFVVQLAERMMSEPEGAALQKLQTIHKQLLGQLTQVILHSVIVSVMRNMSSPRVRYVQS